MTPPALFVDHPWMRVTGIVLIVLFSIWMVRSIWESWRRLHTGRRRRSQEIYDIARFAFGLISAGLVIWLLLTPPPHQLTPGMLVALVFWACSYLALFGLLIFIRVENRKR